MEEAVALYAVATKKRNYPREIEARASTRELRGAKQGGYMPRVAWEGYVHGGQQRGRRAFAAAGLQRLKGYTI